MVKLRLRPNDRLSPDEFLRLIFLNTSNAQSSSSRTNLQKLSVSHPFKRSSSFPTGAVKALESLTYDETIATPSTPTRSVKGLPRSSISRTQTDPLPGAHYDLSLQEALLPNVLVISGIEYATSSVQNALWKVMSEQKITLSERLPGDRGGSWTVPDDFLIVCVSGSGDGRERPSFHKSLVRPPHQNSIEFFTNISFQIDRFALSQEINLSNSSIENQKSTSSSRGSDALPVRAMLSSTVRATKLCESF